MLFLIISAYNGERQAHFCSGVALELLRFQLDLTGEGARKLKISEPSKGGETLGGNGGSLTPRILDLRSYDKVAKAIIQGE